MPASTDETGAGMIGDVDFNSCYYEYASVDLDKLKENLKDAHEALAHFDQLVPVLLRVIAQSNPNGKRNTLAGHVLPDAVIFCAEMEGEDVSRLYLCSSVVPDLFIAAWLDRGQNVRQRDMTPFIKRIQVGRSYGFELLIYPGKK